MTTMTGKQAVMEMLMAEGVKYIFGNPGTSEGPILDALEDYPDLQYVLPVKKVLHWAWLTDIRERLDKFRSLIFT